MRIAFDATTLHARQTGVGYYSQHLLRGLLELGAGHKVWLLSNQPLDPAWTSHVPPDAENNFMSSRTLWLQLRAPGLLRRLRPDLGHFTNSLAPRSETSPLVLTVHDMSVALFPRLHPLRRRLILPLVRASMRRAKKVITVSRSSRDDILRFSGLEPSRVRVVHLAAAPEFRPIPEARELSRVHQRYGLPERFLLFVGTLEPRKNLERLVAAFLQLPGGLRQGHWLVIAGAPGWGLGPLKRRLGRRPWRDRVMQLGYVPFNDLPALYNLATAFVFPSIYEGFGLPVIEAMACGTPVITSATSSMGELFEGAALLIDPEKTGDIERAVRSLLESPEMCREYAERGLQRSGEFSWRKAASETLEVYREALRNSG